LYSLNRLRELGIDFEQGLYEFATDENRQSRFEEAVKRYEKSFVELKSAADVSRELAVASPYDALHHKLAVRASPLALCERLCDSPQIRLITEELNDFSDSDDGVLLNERTYDALIVATSNCTLNFKQFAHLPLRRNRGQLIYLPEKSINAPQSGMNFVNYLVRKSPDEFLLGATFQLNNDDDQMSEEDSEALLASAAGYFPELFRDKPAVSELAGRVSYRAMLADHFPVVGPAPDHLKCADLYRDIRFGRPDSHYGNALYHPGVYLLTGFGSRGMTLAPLMASYLVRQILDGVSILEQSHMTAVHPNRFLVKQLKRAFKK